MISSRIAAAVAVGVLVVGILVGAAGTVLLSGSDDAGAWSRGYHGMMGGPGNGMMRGSTSHDEMLGEMREHMGWSETAPQQTDGAAE